MEVVHPNRTTPESGQSAGPGWSWDGWSEMVELPKNPHSHWKRRLAHSGVARVKTTELPHAAPKNFALQDDFVLLGKQTTRQECMPTNDASMGEEQSVIDHVPHAAPQIVAMIVHTSTDPQHLQLGYSLIRLIWLVVNPRPFGYSTAIGQP